MNNCRCGGRFQPSEPDVTQMLLLVCSAATCIRFLHDGMLSPPFRIITLTGYLSEELDLRRWDGIKQFQDVQDVVRTQAIFLSLIRPAGKLMVRKLQLSLSKRMKVGATRIEGQTLVRDVLMYLQQANNLYQIKSTT